MPVRQDRLRLGGSPGPGPVTVAAAAGVTVTETGPPGGARGPDPTGSESPAVVPAGGSGGSARRAGTTAGTRTGPCRLAAVIIRAQVPAGSVCENRSVFATRTAPFSSPHQPFTARKTVSSAPEHGPGCKPGGHHQPCRQQPQRGRRPRRPAARPPHAPAAALSGPSFSPGEPASTPAQPTTPLARPSGASRQAALPRGTCACWRWRRATASRACSPPSTVTATAARRSGAARGGAGPSAAFPSDHTIVSVTLIRPPGAAEY
jgi:hypothetical protein